MNQQRVLALVGVLQGGVVEPPTRVEVAIPTEFDANVHILAEIRNGRVQLKAHYIIGTADKGLVE